MVSNPQILNVMQILLPAVELVIEHPDFLHELDKVVEFHQPAALQLEDAEIIVQVFLCVRELAHIAARLELGATGIGGWLVHCCFIYIYIYGLGNKIIILLTRSPHIIISIAKSKNNDRLPGLPALRLQPILEDIHLRAHPNPYPGIGLLVRPGLPQHVQKA